MIITRIINDVQVKIRLTDMELLDAYCEQESKFDIESCENYLSSGIYDGEEWYENLDQETKAQIVEDAAFNLRRNINKYEMSYEYALSDAFVTSISNCVKE